MHSVSSFPVWKFLDHWASNTKTKVLCWHTNCRIHFVINYLGIHYTNIEKTEKSSQGENEIWFFCQIDKKLSSGQTNRLLPYNSYTDYTQMTVGHETFTLSFDPFTRLSIFLTTLDNDLSIHFVADKVCHACQSFSLRFICFPISSVACVYGLLSLYLLHRCHFLITLPWAWDLWRNYQNMHKNWCSSDTHKVIIKLIHRAQSQCFISFPSKYQSRINITTLIRNKAKF